MENNDHVLVWRKDEYVPARIIKVNTNVVCCAGTDSKHIHDVTYDVKLKTGEISKGYLSPYGIKAEHE